MMRSIQNGVVQAWIRYFENLKVGQSQIVKRLKIILQSFTTCPTFLNVRNPYVYWQNIETAKDPEQEDTNSCGISQFLEDI